MQCILENEKSINNCIFYWKLFLIWCLSFYLQHNLYSLRNYVCIIPMETYVLCMLVMGMFCNTSCHFYFTCWNDFILTFTNFSPLGINFYHGNKIFALQRLYPEWPHRQGGCLACWRLQDQIPAVAKLHRFKLRMRGSGGTAHEGGGGATSQLHLPSLMPLSIAGYGRLQLGVSHWPSSSSW